MEITCVRRRGRGGWRLGRWLRGDSSIREIRRGGGRRGGNRGRVRGRVSRWVGGCARLREQAGGRGDGGCIDFGGREWFGQGDGDAAGTGADVGDGEAFAG